LIEKKLSGHKSRKDADNIVPPVSGLGET
jgi:hypothetical protein